MIVAVTANEKSLDARVEGCFGKTRFIFVADTETKIVKIIDNSAFADLKSGSGIKTAEMVAKLKVKKIAVKEIGVEALEILKNSNIEVLTECKGSVIEILDYFASVK